MTKKIVLNNCLVCPHHRVGHLTDDKTIEVSCCKEGGELIVTLTDIKLEKVYYGTKADLPKIEVPKWCPLPNNVEVQWHCFRCEGTGCFLDSDEDYGKPKKCPHCLIARWEDMKKEKSGAQK